MNDWQLTPARDCELSLAERCRSYRRETGPIASVIRAGWWLMARSYLRLAHRLEVQGIEHLPAEPPYILVANHASHLDAVILSTLIPLRHRNCVYPLAAGDVFFANDTQSVVSALVLNALPVWRLKREGGALKQLRERLVADRGIFVLFPEGTRSRTGSMAAFQAGLGVMTAGADVPIVPCYLTGAFEAWPPGCRCPRLRRVRVRLGAAHNFAETKPCRAGWESIAATMEQAVRALAEATSKPEPPPVSVMHEV
jgi:1-acyl-sn-glycerol-3-phosphate acyltransferase